MVTAVNNLSTDETEAQTKLKVIKTNNLKAIAEFKVENQELFNTREIAEKSK